MISHFIEASNDANYGKFLLLRFDEREAKTRTRLPGYRNSENIFTFAGHRKLNPDMTFVVDLQTGEGASFDLRGSAKADLEKHKIWVCPMYEFFLSWLYQQNAHSEIKDITRLPRYVQLNTDYFAFAGYRRGETS